MTQVLARFKLLPQTLSLLLLLSLNSNLLAAADQMIDRQHSEQSNSAHQASSSNNQRGMSSYSLRQQQQFIASLKAPQSLSRQQLLSRDIASSMEMRITTERLPKRRFINMWLEGMAINHSGEALARNARYLSRLSRLFKGSLRQGDQLRYDYRPQQGLEVFLNQERLGNIDSGEFYRMLLSTWIGDTPLSSQFKQQILAPTSTDTLQQTFLQLQPDDERRQQIRTWLKPAPEAKAKKRKATNKDLFEVQPISAQIEPLIVPPIALQSIDTKPTVPAPQTGTLTAQQAEQQLAAEVDDENSEAMLLIRQNYYAALAKRAGKYQRYPRHVRKHRTQADVRLAVSIDRSGALLETEVTEGSEQAAFNRQALRTIRRASPFPQVPDEIKGEQFNFTVLLIYQAK